jgi:hypothetical protein
MEVTIMMCSLPDTKEKQVIRVDIDTDKDVYSMGARCKASTPKSIRNGIILGLFGRLLTFLRSKDDIEVNKAYNTFEAYALDHHLGSNVDIDRKLNTTYRIKGLKCK